MNPWRAVTKAEKLPSISSRHHPTRLTLACGHTLLIRGEKAWDARYAKRKRCAQCARRDLNRHD